MSKRPAAKGDPTGESHSESESFTFVDLEPSQPHNELSAHRSLSLADEPRQSVAGADPYNQTRQPTSAPFDKTKRRSLDDMRKLSDAIKRAPTWTPPEKIRAVQLVQRLAMLRGELERVVAEIRELSQTGSAPADVGPIDQLTEAAEHLANALDYMTLLNR